MAAFKDVVGHEQIIEHLISAVEHDMVSHAYIFHGDDGIGKTALAKGFAKLLQCEAGHGDSCDMCHSCKQVESGNQPDIKWITHEKSKTSLGVDEIREQLNGDIQVKPYSGKYKIYIIEDAEKMTQQAQNALLKTIEEPPAYGIILLLTNSMDALLPTIKSRCVTLNVKPATFGQTTEFLMERYQIPDYKARVCAAFAQGNIGKAVRMAKLEDFGAMQEEVLHILKNVDDMEVYEIMDAVKNLAEYKIDIYDAIDMMMVWFRDILMLKITKDLNLLIFADEYPALNKRAKKSSFAGLDLIIKELEKAKVRLHANVNFDTAMELMLLTIKEN